MIKHCIHVDDHGKVHCEINYENQRIFLPIELVETFANDLISWVKTVYPTNTSEESDSSLFASPIR